MCISFFWNVQSSALSILIIPFIKMLCFCQTVNNYNCPFSFRFLKENTNNVNRPNEQVLTPDEHCKTIVWISSFQSSILLDYFFLMSKVFVSVKLSIIVLLLLSFFGLVAKAGRHFASTFFSHKRRLFREKWKLIYILFVFLILVTFPPAPEAVLNAQKRKSKNGKIFFQKKRTPLVSRFFATCLPYLLICLQQFHTFSSWIKTRV